MAGDARRIIEALRSGVPDIDMAREVVFGREGRINEVKRLMEGVEAGRPPRMPAYFFRAYYGEGKTHLLHSLWGMAAEHNWVVSLLILSKETPFDRLDYIYPKLMAETYVPGSRQPGCGRIVSQALTAPLVSATREVELSPRLMAVLDNLSSHNEGYPELVADVGGGFLSLGELKAIHRKNFAKTLKLTRSSLKEEAPQYFRLMDWLIRRAGYQGWLILFDEVELVGKLGRGGRSRAYANIGRFIAGFLPHTVSVWAVASNFESDVVVPRNDREECPAWLAKREKEQDQAEPCGKAVDTLLGAGLLDPLSRQQKQELTAQILALHQAAYGWESLHDAAALYEQVRSHVATRDARLRTWVRLAITVLDVWFQYGEDPRVSRIEDRGEAELSEDVETADEETGRAAIVRQPLF